MAFAKNEIRTVKYLFTMKNVLDKKVTHCGEMTVYTTCGYTDISEII